MNQEEKGTCTWYNILCIDSHRELYYSCYIESIYQVVHSIEWFPFCMYLCFYGFLNCKSIL